jgi:hypothetical protein
VAYQPADEGVDFQGHVVGSTALSVILRLGTATFVAGE